MVAGGGNNHTRGGTNLITRGGTTIIRGGNTPAGLGATPPISGGTTLTPLDIFNPGTPVRRHSSMGTIPMDYASPRLLPVPLNRRPIFFPVPPFPWASSRSGIMPPPPNESEETLGYNPDDVLQEVLRRTEDLPGLSARPRPQPISRFSQNIFSSQSDFGDAASEDLDMPRGPPPLGIFVERERPLHDLCRQFGVTGFGEEVPLWRGVMIQFKADSNDASSGAVENTGSAENTGSTNSNQDNNYSVDTINITPAVENEMERRDTGETEIAVDEGGPWREAIPRIMEELFKPMHGIFETVVEFDKICVQPRWTAFEDGFLDPMFAAHYELFGIVLAMSLAYRAYSPQHLSKVFVRNILKQVPKPEECPELVERMKYRDCLEDLDLTFSVECGTTNCKKNLLKLKDTDNVKDKVTDNIKSSSSRDSDPSASIEESGEEVEVTEENSALYIKCFTDWMLNERFSKAVKHIHVGLHRVMSKEVWAKFAPFVTPDEFEIMSVGHGIDIDDWKRHTSYEGFRYEEHMKSPSPIIGWFWDIVTDLSQQDRDALWTFISGSKGVPPGGFGKLTSVNGEQLDFTIVKVSSSTDHLPVAHTCSYQLDLPEYTSREMLRDRLKMAIQNPTGFGLA